MPVTTIRGGRQITDSTIPYADIQNVTANTVLANNTASATSIQEVSLSNSNLLGRGSTGNISAITASNGLEFSGTVLQTTANLRSLNGLSYASSSFVKMTGANTFTLDTNTYLTSVTDISGYSGTLIAEDNRTISPSELSASRLKFGFTSWANNNTSPYADFLHLRSYTDNSGGNDNLVMFRKDAIGMRIYQQAFGSATAYSSFKDVAWTDGTNASGTWSISTSGNAANVTGTVAVGNGGTGATTLTGILIGNGTSAVTALSSSTAFQVLRVNSAGTGYEFATITTSGIGGSTGSVDNAILRADGTGGSTLQASSIIASDTGDLTLGTGVSGTERIISADSSTIGDVSISLKPRGTTFAKVKVFSGNTAGNTITQGLFIIAESATTPSAGFGVSLNFFAESNNSPSANFNSEVGQIAVKYDTATANLESTEFIFTNKRTGVSYDHFKIKNTGQLQASAYTSVGSFSGGTAIGTLAFTNTGDIVTRNLSDITGTGIQNRIPIWSASNIIGSSTIEDNGTTVTLTQGQLAFPATQNASSNVNTLDDYEEGTWTPTLVTDGVAMTSVTYAAARSGSYTKIGNTVFITGIMQTSALTKGSGSGNALIGGLPFTAVSGDSKRLIIAVGYAATWGSEPPEKGHSELSGTRIFLYRSRPSSTDNDSLLTITDILAGAGNICYFSGHYFLT